MQEINQYWPERLFDFVFIVNANQGSFSKLRELTLSKGYKNYFSIQNVELWAQGPSKIQIQNVNGQHLLTVGDVFGDEDGLIADGHYVAFQISYDGDEIKIFRNFNSSIGVYYSSFDDGCHYIFGDFMRGLEHLGSVYRLHDDLEAIETFKAEGLVGGGDTLTEEVKQIPFRQQLVFSDSSFRLVSEPELKMRLPSSGDEFYELIHRRFSLWLSHCHFECIVMSGGLDSRLLMSALKQLPQKLNIKLVTRKHPELTEDEDRDLMCARELAAIVGYPHLVQRAVSSPALYLSQEAPVRPPVLSGLFGGEYLGGEIAALMDSKYGLHEMIKNYAHAFVSDLYGGAWFLSFFHHNLTLTPFWDSYVIEALLNYPEEKLVGYKLYREIYELLAGELKAIPLNALSFNAYWPEVPLPEAGVEPKSVGRGAPRTREELLEWYGLTFGRGAEGQK